MNKPNYRLGKIGTMLEANIFAGLNLRKYRSNIEDKTFCFTHCSCDPEDSCENYHCRCDTQCKCDNQCKDCYCIGDCDPNERFCSTLCNCNEHEPMIY